MGHGHVIPNKDGSKARCGGPPLCDTCNWEAELAIAKSEGYDPANIPQYNEPKKDVNKKPIQFAEFKGQYLHTAQNHMNQFFWDDKEILGIESFNRHGTHTILVWYR